MTEMSNNEVHLTEFRDSGHVLKVDCWCEPSHITLHTNKFGVEYLVVVHNDETHFHHNMVLHERDIRPDWCSKILNAVPIPKE